jgi:hypothetical protein
LRSGATETGSYGFNFTAATAGDADAEGITFPFPLASAPNVEWSSAGALDSNCSGSAANPTAAPGFLCVYAISDSNVGGFTCVTKSDTAWACGAANVDGAVLFMSAAAPGRAYSVGRWAVTAPTGALKKNSATRHHPSSGAPARTP